MEKAIMGHYLLLFFSAFLAATLLPLSSEAVLYTLLHQGKPAWLLLSIASLGNTLGAAINWLLGRFLLRYQDRWWFTCSPQQMARAQQWFQRFGLWSLLFAWLPVGGDALTFIAGVMRIRFWVFLLLVGIGKSSRYLFVWYFARWTTGG
jgi:membrane protein YqaA with SNARE-associated domain